jgi:hypothetical protein
LYFP